MARASFLLSLCLISINVAAQRADSIQRKRLNLVIVGAASAYTGSMIALNEAWYSQYDRQSFQFFDDSKEWMQVDKVGHFYATFQSSHLSSRMLQWAGVSEKKSDQWGALASFVMVSSIEVFDGFSTGYGASATDLVANAVGAGLYYGEKRLWNEIRIQPKFSFHRTVYPDFRPELLGTTTGQQIVKDYNGQTYWLSADLDKFIRFPKWLNIAIGYGAEDMISANRESNEAQGFTPYRQVYLALDFDLTAFRSKSKFWNSVIFFVNMIKLPAPTLEFSRGGVHAHFFYY
jgi:hypothetical protein